MPQRYGGDGRLRRYKDGRRRDARAVQRHLRELDVPGQVVEFSTEVPTAAAAAEQLGCPVGAIANSLVFAVDNDAAMAYRRRRTR